MIALFVFLAVVSGLITSTLAFASEGGVLYHGIGLDGDWSDDNELLCPKGESVINSLPLNPRHDAMSGDNAVRNLNQSPAMQPIPV